MSNDRVVTVRLAEDTITQLEALAAIDDETLAHEIRAAIGSYLASRQQDPNFADQIRTFRERQAAIVKVFDSARAG